MNEYKNEIILMDGNMKSCLYHIYFTFGAKKTKITEQSVNFCLKHKSSQ